MPSFLRLNGITVPVALGSSPGVTREFIGKNKRALDGSMHAVRRTQKNVWKVETALRSAAESLAFRNLVVGSGHVLSFDNLSFYTSKGLPPDYLDGTWAVSAGSAKFGAAKATFDGGDSADYSFFSSSSPWTLAWWFNAAAAGWHHYVQTSAGGKWIDGVSSPGGSMLGLTSVTAGTATFGSVAASNAIDDIVALPYVVPSDWPSQMYNFGHAFGLLPALTADGDFIEQNSRVSVIGGEPSATLVRGAAAKNLHSLSFDLFER